MDGSNREGIKISVDEGIQRESKFQWMEVTERESGSYWMRVTETESRSQWMESSVIENQHLIGWSHRERIKISLDESQRERMDSY